MTNTQRRSIRIPSVTAIRRALAMSLAGLTGYVHGSRRDPCGEATNPYIEPIVFSREGPLANPQWHGIPLAGFTRRGLVRTLPLAAW